MRLAASALGFFAAITLAVPAHADPGAFGTAGEDNPAFLASLRAAGINYRDSSQAISAARAVCGMIDGGKSGLEVLTGLETENPDFTTDGAARFAALAANAYCPQQLSKAG